MHRDRWRRPVEKEAILSLHDIALLAQLVEHFHGKEGVIGSSPIEGLGETRGAEPVAANEWIVLP